MAKKKRRTYKRRTKKAGTKGARQAQQRRAGKREAVAEPEADMTLGEAIKKVRERRRHSQPQAAQVLGVYKHTLARWEENRTEPKLRHFYAIADYLEQSPNDLRPYVENYLEQLYEREKAAVNRRFGKASA